ncbi:MAG: hypothetical protein RL701_1504 [Pseudomonadota bacterium]|jgi:hypothetical protein
MAHDMRYWQGRANEIYSCNSSASTHNVAQNALITKAYAQMYLSNPKAFKWAGLAAFASRLVGVGIMAGKATDIFVDSQYRKVVAESLETSAFTGRPPLKNPEARLNAWDLDNMLIAGNKAIYRDIYWQHLAYREDGLDAVLNMLAGTPKSASAIEAWKAIDAGVKTSDLDKVWFGNQLLAYYEQWVVLQPIYDAFPDTADGLLSYLMISPLPDDFTLFKYDYWNHSFREAPPRWDFIVKRLIPYWRALDADQSSAGFGSRLQLLAMGHMNKRVICLVL